jgi:hypothetical protein
MRSRVVEFVRWRLGDRGPHNPIRRRQYWWAFGGDSWIPLVAPYDSGGRVSTVPALSAAIRAEGQQLLDAHDSAPLTHELWREAWELRDDHPRSALLIGMSALEIGLKQHIAAMEPGTTWLLEAMPAPSAARLMGEYVPKLHGRDRVFTRQQLDLVKKATAARNKVTHTGGVEVRADFLDAVLELVRTVLRTLEFLAGHRWAAYEVPPARTEDYPDRRE